MPYEGLDVAGSITLWAQGHRDRGGDYDEAALALAQQISVRALQAGHDVHSAFEMGRSAYFEAVRDVELQVGREDGFAVSLSRGRSR